MNKYEKIPEHILDLHGHTTKEAKVLIDELLASSQFSHVRIITGKGAFRETGPVMRSFVEHYLEDHDIRFNTSKLYNGGDGAFEVFLGDIS
jgi:DNA-nicking Smr family endonuclease